MKNEQAIECWLLTKQYTEEYSNGSSRVKSALSKRATVFVKTTTVFPICDKPGRALSTPYEDGTQLPAIMLHGESNDKLCSAWADCACEFGKSKEVLSTLKEALHDKWKDQ